MLFTEEWVEALRTQVTMFFNKSDESDRTPILAHLIYNYTSTNEQVKELKEDYTKMEFQMNVFKERSELAISKLIESQTKWTSFTKDILNISKELFRAIHFLKSNVAIPEKFLEISEDRILKYESFLNSNEAAFFSEEDRQTLEETAAQSQTQLLTQSEERRTISLSMLNYNKVKDCFKNGDNEKLRILIQILKQKLVQPGSNKKQILQLFISNDLFDCKNPKGNILERLFTQHSKR